MFEQLLPIKAIKGLAIFPSWLNWTKLLIAKYVDMKQNTKYATLISFRKEDIGENDYRH